MTVPRPGPAAGAADSPGRERKRKRCWLLLGGSWWLRTGDRYPDVRAFKRMKPPAPRLAPAATRASPHGACDVYNKRMTARGGGCRLRSPLLVRCVFRVSHAETRAARDFTRLERRALLVGSTRQVKLSSFCCCHRLRVQVFRFDARDGR